MSELTRDTLNALTLVAAACGLVLIAGVAMSLLVATFRVGVLGRVLATPFRGLKPEQSELTSVFLGRLADVEQEWTALAHEVHELLGRFEEESLRAVRTPPGQRSRGPLRSATPLADGAPVDAAAISRVTASTDLGVAPRTLGDEFLDDILLLEQAGSVADADLRAISVAGVSFSPQSMLALLRRLPALTARRILSGTTVVAGGRAIVSVAYRERAIRGPSHTARRTTEVADDAWLAGFDGLAFDLAKARIGLLRERRGRRRLGRREALRASGSSSVDRTVVEAESWPACREFLLAYCAQIRHYLSGSAQDRELALRHYAAALQHQPAYARAAYNTAVLLYNRYLPKDNESAIGFFEDATKANDLHDRALALVGLAMAHCQAVHRFKLDPAEHVLPAVYASRDAIDLEPELPDALFAAAWTHQIRSAWTEAIESYERAWSNCGNSPPDRRIASFAYNNAAWILLSEDQEREGALVRAEKLLWQAVDLYPNKIAYANLAEIARRRERHGTALEFLVVAVRLDPMYANGWHERACIEVELAAIAAADGDPSESERFLADARSHAAHATELVGRDGKLAGSLQERFERALEQQGLATPT